MAKMQQQIHDLRDAFQRSQAIRKEFDFINQQITNLKEI